MDAAKDVIDDLNRAPEAIGKAYADIITAITNLERVGNKAALVCCHRKSRSHRCCKKTAMYLLH